MAAETVDLAIMFADISGSTRLYEVLGDNAARARVAQRVAGLCKAVARHHGTTLKTIGDGIMCTFASVDDAVAAACDMQASTGEDDVEVTSVGPLSLALRIGLHYGSAITEEGDAFGDAVNVAARMGALAKPGQIITTRETVDQMSANRDCDTRFVDHAPVRGKRLSMEIHEILWQPEDVTWLSIPLNSRDASIPRLQLRYRRQALSLDAERTVAVLGRGTGVDLSVSESLASRLHVRIEQRRGKYFLTDLSTNGTHVRCEGSESFVRREEIPLSGKGEISLGRPFNERPAEIVHFEVELCPAPESDHP